VDKGCRGQQGNARNRDINQLRFNDLQAILKVKIRGVKAKNLTPYFFICYTDIIMETVNERQKRYRKERLDAGLCTRCGKNEIQQGRTYCATCSEIVRKHTKHLYDTSEEYKEKTKRRSSVKRAKLKAKGLCPHCGVNLSDKGYCESCKVTHRVAGAAHAAARRVELKAAGLCQDCGQVPANGRCSKCRAKRNEITTTLVAARKRECVALLGGKCVDCGLESEYPAVYDFHHPDPNQKDFNIAKILTYKRETWMAELLKCVLICSNCHRIRHSKEKE
jgi:hypothetical protein